MGKSIEVFLLLFLFLVPLVSSDIFSLNSGGDENVIINPNEQIEGFFSSAIVSPSIPVCGNGIIESGETCDDGNIASGDGCSATCQTETPTTTTTTTTGGGGGGGGTSVTATPGLQITPTSINLNMVVNTIQEQIITVKNTGNTSLNLNISNSGLDGIALLTVGSISLAPLQTKTIIVRFAAPGSTGIYTGKIIIGASSVPVALNVKTKLLLFDSAIIVLNNDSQVPQGDSLLTRVTLIPMGDKERLDVTLNYVIKDYSEKVYFTKTETLLVTDRVEFDRTFNIAKLPIGQYIIGLELHYPNGVAPSSAHFDVIEKKGPNIFGIIVLILIILILLILIIIIIILIIKYIQKKREEELRNSPQ